MCIRDRGYSLEEKRFPYSPQWNREHRLVCALKGLQLKEDFVSLRYTNTNLPVLHILCRKQEGNGYTELTPPLEMCIRDSFHIESVRLLYSNYYTAPKGYLFGMAGQTFIWNTQEEAMEITQNAMYDTYGYLPVADYAAESAMKDTWVATTKSANGREGIWYKKILYMYEYPAKLGDGSAINPIQIEVNYTLNGVSAKATVNVEDEKQVPYAIERNTVYTLQIGETEAPAGALTFKFVFAPWTVHDVDVDLNDGITVTGN